MLKLMSEKPSIRAKKIAEAVGMTPRGVQKISKLSRTQASQSAWARRKAVIGSYETAGARRFGACHRVG
ncbi:MAG: hypothetical protein LBQ15_10205 [Clostridium sp.]|nr:hypothetical protein [Clostridium sp.]